jgi:hypothetical protein
MSTSIAAKEAFELLNAATQKEWRGWGDTRTAARDRAAKKAGLTPAQAERLWKNWQTTKFPNADVYRLLRNTYGHLCAWVENAADAIERETRGIEESNAVDKSPVPSGAGMARPARSPAEQEMR